jgi:hypothetical protein
MVASATTWTDPATWYTEVDGVLGTDYYSLYPYKTLSTKLGFSQFGELIDSNTNVGLEYAGVRDPFAAPAGSGLDPYGKLPKKVWINGWYIDLTYNHASWGLRNVWAGALFADLSTYGGPWIRVDKSYGSCTYEWQENFMDPGWEIDASGAVVGTTLVYGGRKTNGTVTTAPVEVLYDGPRMFIARLVNTVSDYNDATNDTLPIVDVIFTIIFDKAGKQVEILKDVKMLPTAKFQLAPLSVIAPVKIDSATMMQRFDVTSGILCQFSDREEWDLGSPSYLTTPKYSSYVHFYTEGKAPNDTVIEGQPTVYDSFWTALPTLPADVSVVGGYTNTSAYGPAPTGTTGMDTYDVAQIVSNDKAYVGYAGYWPSLSDWSADAGGGRRNIWYRAMLANDSHDIDSYAVPNDEPFLAPLTVGEWDFMLSDSHRTVGPITADAQFRGVAVYGVTDLNAGTWDRNMLPTPYPNVIDREAQYLLNTVYNPWDLDKAQDTDYMRWVQKLTADGSKAFMLRLSDMFPARPAISGWPYVYANYFPYQTVTLPSPSPPPWVPWDSYCNFTERVLVDGVLQTRGVDYTLWTNATWDTSGGYYHNNGYIWVNFTTAPAVNATIKILFSTVGLTLDTYALDGSWNWGVVGKEPYALPIDCEALGMATEWAAVYNNDPVDMTASDMQNTAYAPAAPYVLSQMRPTLLPDKNAYRDANPAFNKGRAAFMDDWSCHQVDSTWLNGVPIASSNIMSLGGPSANMVSEYFNDFSDAFATLPQWTPNTAYASEIMPLTCWSFNKNDISGVLHAYKMQTDATGKQTIGYGVISTYKDLNGTVGLMIWGYTGQDTYYTAWSLLHSDVLYLALRTMPYGVTSLVLQFNYTLHPTDYCFVTILEALGTISEFDFQGYLTYYSSMVSEYGTACGWPSTWLIDKFPTIHIDP